MDEKTVEGHKTIYLRGGGTIDIWEGKIEIGYAVSGRAQTFRFSGDEEPEVVYLNDEEVIAITVKKKPGGRRSTQGSSNRTTPKANCRRTINSAQFDTRLIVRASCAPDVARAPVERRSFLISGPCT